MFTVRATESWGAPDDVQAAFLLERKLDASNPSPADDRIQLSESEFRWSLNEDAMATEKLAEGIRTFARDQQLLEDKLASL